MDQDTWEKMTFDQRWGETRFNPDADVSGLAGTRYDEVYAGIEGVVESGVSGLSETGVDWVEAGLVGADEIYQKELDRGSLQPDFLASLFALDAFHQAQQRDGDLKKIAESFQRRMKALEK